MDWGVFHPLRRGGIARNAVFYPDYRADWMKYISNTEAGKFINDMRKYGG